MMIFSDLKKPYQYWAFWCKLVLGGGATKNNRFGIKIGTIIEGPLDLPEEVDDVIDISWRVAKISPLVNGPYFRNGKW